MERNEVDFITGSGPFLLEYAVGTGDDDSLRDPECSCIADHLGPPEPVVPDTLD